MYRISDRFKQYLTRSHNIVSRVDVLENDVPIITGLPVERGYVRDDAENAIRRQGRAEVYDPEGQYTPTDLRSALAPGRNEIRLWRGIRFDDGAEELVPMGTLRISDVEISDSRENMEIIVSGFDRSRPISRNRLTTNYTIPAGTNYGTAIRDMVANFAPFAVTFNFVDVASNIVTPKLVFGASGDMGGGDPWKYATEMAESIGMELFFDPVGVCRLRRVPAIGVDPVVWTYDEGPKGIMLYVNRRISDEEFRNYILVTGESTSNTDPVSAVAQDNSATSETGIPTMGRVPGFFQSRYIRTTAQAQEMADAQLRKRIGATEAARIISIVNPAHEAGDVIKVVRARSKVNRQYVMQNLTIPLGAQEVITLVMKEQRF